MTRLVSYREWPFGDILLWTRKLYFEKCDAMEHEEETDQTADGERKQPELLV